MPVPVKRIFIVGLVGVGLLSGCGGGPREDARLTVDPKNPLALFRGEDLGLIEYVQQKLRNRCLAEAGYPQNAETMLDRPRPAFTGLVITARSFGPTSEQEARRIGFGRDNPAEPPVVVSTDPNYNRQLDACTGRAWRRLDDEARRVIDAYNDLGNKLLAPLMRTIDARMDPGLPAKLLSCLREQGYRVPNDRAFLAHPDPRLTGVRLAPPPSAPELSWKPKRIPGTVEVGPAVPARQYRATTQEGALAVAWLRCKQRIGLAGQQLSIAVQVQNELVTKHETTFAELNPEIQRIAKRAAALLGST